MTDPSTPAKSPVHVCCLCADNGTNVVAVGAQEAASGPGQTLFACPKCAPSVRAVFTPGDN
ncbi:hypothetical protein [Kitasatospora sp. NPDC088779]|uniref:hypothetical protein n=1 Tax=Kitasatospora sp. NPDC088779 TaxID=3154964 RepID=UPI0034295CF2